MEHLTQLKDFTFDHDLLFSKYFFFFFLKRKFWVEFCFTTKQLLITYSV